MLETYKNPYIDSNSSKITNRSLFIKKTYIHLGLAILAFTLLEAFLLSQPWVMSLAKTMTGGISWLIVLGAFMGVSYLANKLALSQTSVKSQYVGLALYVIIEAIIFLPLMIIASQVSNDGDIIKKAAIATLFMFLGITMVAFVTKKDFSFLRIYLTVGGFVALGFIVLSLIFGFNLGTIFILAMIGFASISILYTTSQIIHYYNESQYVAASLNIFSSVMLLFWYILSFLIRSRD